MDTSDTPESSMLYCLTLDLPIPWSNESPIAVIPNELLLCISECLDRTSLLNLSLVAHCFRDIAQEVLFRHVDLYGPPASTLSSPYGLARPRRAWAIKQFKWSLEQRPHLAAKVRTIKWDPLERVQSSDSWSLLNCRRATMPRLEFDLIMQRLLEGLRQLNAGSNSESNDDEEIDFLKIVDVGLPKCLRHLTSLSFHEHYFSFGWCRLPKLQRLEIGGMAVTSTPSKNIGPSPPQISVLSLHCTVETATFSDVEFQSTNAQAIAQLSKIRLLEVEFRPGVKSLHSRKYEFSIIIKKLVLIFQKMHGCLDSMQELDIKTPGTYYNQELTEPVGDFAHFPSLRRLAIAQEMFLPTTSTFGLHELFPPKLEKLTLYYPHVCIFGWLADVLKERQSFPSLTTISLVVAKKNKTWSELRAKMEDLIVDDLRRAGIDLTLGIE